MPIKSKYLFVASMDVDPDKEALFNEVYDTEHVPNLLKVPGVHAVARLQGEPFALSMGGEEKKVAHNGPRYSAVYEIDGSHVLVSPEWARAKRAAGRRKCGRIRVTGSTRSTDCAEAFAFPGRGAARSEAERCTADPGLPKRRACQERGACDGPGSAAHRCAFAPCCAAPGIRGCEAAPARPPDTRNTRPQQRELHAH